jgi:iron(III) transport system permease protein
MRPARATDPIAGVPLAAAVAFLALFTAVPLLLLLAGTVLGPDGPTLAAYAAWLHDPGDRERLLASAGLGLASTALALLLGGGHAWLCFATDLPAGKWLLPLGVAPLVVPPIFVAMGLADVVDAAGFWPCALLLGVAHAPFVAVFAGRGLRAVDGRAYEAALLARGRGAAERLLLRLSAPELVAGSLLAFLFTLADHGVPEFLTVKGKSWHTYAEGLFSRWTRRAVGTDFVDTAAPVAAAVPFVALLAVVLYAALRLKSRHDLPGVRRPLPLRRLAAWRWPALLVPAGLLGLGIVLPVVVLARWAFGSAQQAEPMSFAFARQSLRKAIDQGGIEFLNSIGVAVAAAAVVVVLALPLARAAARRRPWLELACALPLAVPAILFGIGLVRVFGSAAAGSLYAWTGDFYASWGFALCGYAARFLPFAVLLLAAQVRRAAAEPEAAALLSGRSRWQRALRIHLPPLLPACWSAAIVVFVLALRELDLAVVLPAANATAVRRLANAVHFQHEDWSGVLALALLATAVLLPFVPTFLAGRRLRTLA